MEPRKIFDYPRCKYKCNPFNIRLNENNRWRGEVKSHPDGFCQFGSIFYGVRAYLILMRVYIFNHDCVNIEKIVSRYAPPSENNTKQYIKYVSEQTGIHPLDDLTILDKNAFKYSMYLIASAMCRMECGGKLPYFIFSPVFENVFNGDKAVY